MVFQHLIESLFGSSNETIQTTEPESKETIFKRVLETSQDEARIEAVLERVTDEKLLVDFFKSERPTHLRMQALIKLKNNNNVHLRLLLDETDPQFCEQLFKWIQKQNDFACLVKDAASEDVQKKAFLKLSDPDPMFLIDIATAHSNPTFRDAARSQLKQIKKTIHPYYVYLKKTERCWSCEQPVQMNIPDTNYTCRSCKNRTHYARENIKHWFKGLHQFDSPMCIICGDSLELPKDRGMTVSCNCGVRYKSYSPSPIIRRAAANKMKNGPKLFWKLIEAEKTVDSKMLSFSCRECKAPVSLQQKSSYLHKCEFCGKNQYVEIATKLKNNNPHHHWIVHFSPPKSNLELIKRISNF